MTAPSGVDLEQIAPSTPTLGDRHRPHQAKPPVVSALSDRVPVEPVAAHLRALQADGMRQQTIADLGGCSLSTVRDLLGRHKSTVEPIAYHRIDARIAARLLAIEAPPRVEPDRSWMSRARCFDVDPGFFFPERDHHWQAAVRQMCAGCPVVAECGLYGHQTSGRKDWSAWYGGAPLRASQSHREAA